MTDETIPPGQEPQVVVRTVDAGPLPVEPMKEGGDHIAPGWLQPYTEAREQERAKMLPEQQAFFDSLWDRAIGKRQPALSGRERLALFVLLGGQRAAQ